MQKESNNKLMLFLGAGASHFAGYHTFVDFPELLFNPELRKEEGMPPLSPNPERLLKAIRTSLERNNKPTTHDNFLWRLDGYTQLLRLNESDDALQEFLKENSKLYDLHICTEQAISQISATTIHHYSTNRVRSSKSNNIYVYESMKKVFELFYKLSIFNSQNAFLPIYTTNYDMLIEDLVTEFNNQDGFSINLSTGIHGLVNELDKWKIDEYKVLNDYSTTFHLYRLHGCVCWFYHTHTDGNVYFHRRDAINQEVDRLCAMYPGRETKKGVGPHGYSFRSMYQHLQKSDLIIFIGFSFRDDDVVHLLLKALSERKGKLKILVIDQLYNKDDIINKLEDSASRFTFPYRIPQNSDIDSLTINFGIENNFGELILEKCHSLLK